MWFILEVSRELTDLAIFSHLDSMIFTSSVVIFIAENTLQVPKNPPLLKKITSFFNTSPLSHTSHFYSRTKPRTWFNIHYLTVPFINFPILTHVFSQLTQLLTDGCVLVHIFPMWFFYFPFWIITTVFLPIINKYTILMFVSQHSSAFCSRSHKLSNQGLSLA